MKVLATTDVPGQVAQCFIIRVRNNAGTIEHVFGGGGTITFANDQLAAVNGASLSFVTTPAGTDSSTAFTGGAKISSATTHRLIIDTADQVSARYAGIATIVNQTAAANGLQVRSFIASINVNGVTRNRLCLEYVDRTGNAFALGTGTMGSSTVIDTAFFGFLAR